MDAGGSMFSDVLLASPSHKEFNPKRYYNLIEIGQEETIIQQIEKLEPIQAHDLLHSSVISCILSLFLVAPRL